MKDRTVLLTEAFFQKHGDLVFMKEEIMAASDLITDAYKNGNKVLICGNGGSSADADHIVGELMKGFLLKRPLDSSFKEKLRKQYGSDGEALAEKLQGSLPAISLNTHGALCSAFANDVDPAFVYAQQVLGYGNSGDVLIGISTSGNASTVYYAMVTAEAKGLTCIALTGRDGGRLAQVSRLALIAPAQETYLIQEYHLAIYHFICSYVESELFEC